MAAVLIGAGTHFMTASDLRELGTAIHQPELPEVIVAIEQCSLPIIAAMHGATLGSGFEIALACDGRTCAPDAVVGLPQVSLGVIPGGGATQRLVGRAVAVDMVCSGRSVGADEAIALKVVDRVEAGPVVMLAAGGIWAEVARDRSIRLAPVTIEAAREMVDEVRALRTVSGLRGKARGDLEALAAAVCALSQLALKPKLGIHEAEVNPMVLAERQGVVAMDALILRLPRPSGTG